MSGATQDVTPTTQKSSSAATIFTGLDREQLITIAETLESENQIGSYADRPLPNDIVVLFRSTDIYRRLVSLYTNLFTTYWDTFKYAVAQLSTQEGVTRQQQLANVYVTAWFYDLYVTNRESNRRISSEVYHNYYSQDVSYIAGRFDPFLQHLNTVIRPTRILNTMEDVVYYPIFSLNPTWQTPGDNIFNIPGAFINHPTLRHLLQIFEDPRNEFSTVPLNTNVYGRPGWLFDYRLGEAYAWFPMEENYTAVDLVGPHILGRPCSPRLGPCDIDDPQPYYRNSIAKDPYRMGYERKTERKFHGSAEYRTIETIKRVIDFKSILDPSDEDKKAFAKRVRSKSLAVKTTQASSSGAAAVLDVDLAEPPREPTNPKEIPPTVTVNFYRIRDWCYQSKVVFGRDSQTINKAFRSMILKGNATSSN
nr:coat protein [Partitiviridae sp.]